MVGQNIGLGSWPQRRARMDPESIALRFNDLTYTYRQLAQRVEALAAGWWDRGIRPGDRVAYCGPNHPALLVTLFALGRIGAITVLINPRLARHEIEYILQDAGARAVVHHAATRANVQRAVTGLGPVEILEVGTDAFETLLSADPAPDVEVGMDDPCLLMYTSGTTGKPKGAVLSHGNLFFNDVNVLVETDLRNSEVCLAVAPLYHIAGLNGLVLPVILKGGTVVIHETFHPDAVLETIRTQQITCLFGVPAMLDALSAAEGFTPAGLDSLRTVIVGGAPVPSRTLRLWAEHGVDVQQGYGLTETAPAVLKLSADDASRYAGAAGKPQFFVDVKLADPRGGDATAEGEILTRGPNVISGYWNRPDADQTVFDDDGWFRTGDIAEVSEQGYYTLKDRAKDMYISGGENIYPAEIESALMDIDGIAEAAVIGVPDERWGEVGRAFVVVKTGVTLDEAQVLDALQSRLARYKQPKTIILRDELPRTSTGKLRKNILRDQESTR